MDGHCLSLHLFFNRPTLYLSPFLFPMQLLVSEHPGYWKLASNCLASFRSVASPFSFSSHDVSTLLRRFSLVCTKSVCLDTTSENLEDRNCSDVTEIFFFQQSTKIDTLLYRNFFSIIETKLRSNNHFRSFLEERRFLFSNLEKTLENCSDYLC